MQFTFSSAFWAFGPNYPSDLYESLQIYIGDDVHDHKLSSPSVDWSVGWLVGDDWVQFTFSTP